MDGINSPATPNDKISQTFKEKLLGKDDTINISTDHSSTLLLPMDIQEWELDSHLNENLSLSVPITLEDKQRIYHPWKYSLIIKLQGRRILHQILKQKIQDL